MAAGSQAEKGICALFVHADKIIIKITPPEYEIEHLLLKINLQSP
jgi:hypothetical protein